MHRIKTMVVEDEPLARARLVRLLEKCPDIDLVGEARNGGEARSLYSRFLPELLFLDIQMPDFNGFQLLEKNKLDGLPSPFVIFVTAYDHYAVRAFDIQAVDYLLKPYDDDRFQKALENARRHIQLQNEAQLHHKMVRLIKEHETQKKEGPALEILDKGRTVTLRPTEIYFFQAQGNYVMVFLKQRKFLHRITMQQLEEQWPDQFIRVHRSLMINKRFLARVTYRGNNQYALELYNGHILYSGRAYKEVIQHWLDEQDSLPPSS